MTRGFSCVIADSVPDALGGQRVRLNVAADTQWKLELGTTGQTASASSAAPSQVAQTTATTLQAPGALRALPTSWGVITE